MIGKNKIRIQVTISKKTLLELEKCNKITHKLYPNVKPSTKSEYIETAIMHFNHIVHEWEKEKKHD